jgi:hypothetical protein
MFCHVCGESNPDGANFCNKCSNNLIVKEFSIDFFIKQNKDLLVCLGVFGALTIYLMQISSSVCVDSPSLIKSYIGNFCYVDLGVASSLIIFLCLGFAIFVKLLGISDDGPRPFEFNFGNIVRMILLIPFGALLSSLSFFVINSLSAPSQIIVIFIMGFLGALFFFGSIKFLFSLISSRLFRWIGFVVLFFVLCFPAGWAILTANYYLSFFLTIFNVFNLLFIIGYPILILTHQSKKANFENIVKIAKQQLKK